MLIVGGGVIGLSLAWELAQRGRQVTLIEAGKIGRGASWAGAGILPPAATLPTGDPYEQLRAFSHSLHPEWAAKLGRLTGIDTGFRRCGGTYLARSPGEVATLTANEFWWETHGIAFQRWTTAQLLSHEPALFSGTASEGVRAWWLPEESQLRNPRHLRALLVACRQAGVEFHESTAMTSVDVSGPRIGVVAGDQRFRAHQVCICSGAWARGALEQLGLSSGIMPVRGQMLMFRSLQPLLKSVVNEGHRYLVPRDDGRLLAGSIEEEAGYKVETTEGGLREIRDWAESVLPVLAHCNLEKSWAGLRPGSYDGFPYLGSVPHRADLFIAAGHFRSGLHLSPATAVVMSNCMMGETSPIDLHPFRVSRG